jgi:hypothetical protein
MNNLLWTQPAGDLGDDTGYTRRYRTVTRHDNAPKPCGMLINIMVTTVAADPAVALEPRDYLVPVGFQLQHGHRLMCKYMQLAIFVKKNA